MKQGIETGGTCYAEGCSKPALTYAMGDGVIRNGALVGSRTTNLCDEHKHLVPVLDENTRKAGDGWWDEWQREKAKEPIQ